MKELTILGCAWPQIPLIFDVAYETLGLRNYRILKNIPVDVLPGLLISKDFYNYTVHEPDEKVALVDHYFILGVTGPKAKLAVYSFFNARYDLKNIEMINIIHPTSYIATSSILEQGAFIEPKVIVSSMAKIGFAVTLKRGVSIGHHSRIGDYTEINPGVIISGNATIGRGCIIGSGAVLKNQISIGDNTFIGMGSVVTEDIPPGVIAYGNPCKIIRKNDKWNI